MCAIFSPSLHSCNILVKTWASVFTSSGFTHKATPVSHAVSPVPLMDTNWLGSVLHLSKSTCYGSVTGIKNSDLLGFRQNLHVLKKLHYFDSMETQMKNTSLQGRSSSGWSTTAICCQRTSLQTVSWTLPLQVFSICLVAVARLCMGLLSNKWQAHRSECNCDK